MKIKLFRECPKPKVKVAELDTAKKYPGWLHVDATAEYSAKACLENTEIAEQKMLDCVLHVGHDPDVVAELLYDDNFITYKKDKDDKDCGIRPRFRFKLFSQTLGASQLFFSCKNNGRYEEYCLANVWVNNGEKKDLYDKMVEQLVSCEMPQYVVTHFKWQMLYHKFRLDWKDGYATYIDDDMMLEELKVLTKDIQKCLKVITLRPYEQIRNGEGYSYVSKLKKLDARGRRAIEKNQLLKRSCECKVLAQKKVVSFDCIAHDVFKTFLLENLARIVIICENFQKKINERQKKINTYIKTKDHPWKRTLGREVDKLEELLGQAVWLKEAFNKCLNLSILMKSWKRVTIFEVCSSAFMINAGYYNLYKVMLNFSRKSFWWDKDRDLPWKRRPKLELDRNNGKPRLQFKYSITYENWMIAQFCLALEGLGYKMEKCSDVLNNSYRYRFTKEDVVVKLYHGIEAKPRGLFRNTYYCTPDFAIIVSRKGSNHFAWMLGDAKSGKELTPKMTEIYLKYQSITYKEEKPFAIVVVLSGEEQGYYGIKFPCPYVNDKEEKAWKDHDALSEWRDGDGITWNASGAFLARGAMCMNVGDSNVENNVNIFIDGLIKTGLRKLDERDGEGGM